LKPRSDDAAEMIDRRIPDANVPNLRVGKPGQQSLAGGKGIVSLLKFAALDVKGDNTARITGRDLRFHLPLIDLLTSAGVFVLRVSRFSHRHGVS
jgi:hypothetical protein